MSVRRRPRRGVLPLALVLLPALLAAAFFASSCRLPIQRGRWNVVVVLVDTLRADHLGAYGYDRPTSPRFDALAAESYLFTDARAQAPCTYPSVNSLLTSRYPARFLGQPDGALGIPPNIPSLAEMLAAQGFTTAAVSASPVVRKSPSRFNPHGGFDRGFARFDESCLWRDAACVTGRGLWMSERLREPFFLYLHYLDPHGPYAPPAPFRKQLRMSRTREPWALRGNPNPLARALEGGAAEGGVAGGGAAGGGAAGGGAATGGATTDGATTGGEGGAFHWARHDVRFLAGLYDGEIAFFDSQLGALVDRLREKKLMERTIFVVLSDHGEAFLEHGGVKHCRTVYDEEIKTPLLVRLPRQRHGERLAGPADNLDLVPTLVDLLGLPVDGQGFEGRSLLPRLNGAAAEDRVSFAMMNVQRSAAGARYKLVADFAAGSRKLYDLRSDPRETRDVATAAREPFARLQRELETWRARTEGAAGL
ncbi:MAG TPA: sulfatase, partial [Thermoanaerobaculia bacterium]|nr:sulfatase [Thermoanaerobaculia bacterium]